MRPRGPALPAARAAQGAARGRDGRSAGSCSGRAPTEASTGATSARRWPRSPIRWRARCRWSPSARLGRRSWKRAWPRSRRSSNERFGDFAHDGGGAAALASARKGTRRCAMFLLLAAALAAPAAAQECAERPARTRRSRPRSSCRSSRLVYVSGTVPDPVDADAPPARCALWRHRHPDPLGDAQDRGPAWPAWARSLATW